MGTQEIVLETKYADKDHEQWLKTVKSDILSKVQIDGKQFAKNNTPKTGAEDRAISVNYIQAALQEAIGHNQQKYLPISGAAVAKLVDIESDKQIRQLQIDINDSEVRLQSLKNELKAFHTDVSGRIKRKFVLLALFAISASEMVLSYPAYRHSGYSTLQSLIASVIVGIVVGFGTEWAGGYVKRGKTPFKRKVRFIACVVPAAICFAVLGNMRAKINADSDSLETTDLTPQVEQLHTSAIGIAVLSLAVFIIGLLLSYHVYRTKEQRVAEDEYIKKQAEVNNLLTTIRTKEEEIAKVIANKNQQMLLALQRFEYAKHTEKIIVDFAPVAHEHFKASNIRHRTDGIPPFFSERASFTFKLFFNNQN